ncbi:unnamed protein product, partial [Nesidiocoris tenuis]
MNFRRLKKAKVIGINCGSFGSGCRRRMRKSSTRWGHRPHPARLRPSMAFSQVPIRSPAIRSELSSTMHSAFIVLRHWDGSGGRSVLDRNLELLPTVTLSQIRESLPSRIRSLGRPAHYGARASPRLQKTLRKQLRVRRIRLDPAVPNQTSAQRCKNLTSLLAPKLE